MTGQGDDSRTNGEYSVRIEIRSVNNRHLKTTIRSNESLSGFDHQVEPMIRQFVRRGHLNVNIRVESIAKSATTVDRKLLDSYILECVQAAERCGLPTEQVAIADCLSLPGVLDSNAGLELSDSLTDLLNQSLRASVEKLNAMRRREGLAMLQQISLSAELLRKLAGEIAGHAPSVIQDYQQRLLTKINTALEEVGIEVAKSDILREVQVFSDRCDIREEIVRLTSHLDQFQELCEGSDSHGRKLDFLTQELFRETNTIGSKANNAAIAQRVVEMKTVIEQIREIVQNIE